MHQYLAFLTLLAVSVNSLPAAPHIKIGELPLVRAYAPDDSPVALRMYLPAGETLEHWHRLASVRVLQDLQDPAEYLSNMAAVVAQSHPAARFKFLRNDRTKELVLDFTTFAPDSVSARVAEWNLMRARYVPGTGLLVYQYAMRLYPYGASSGAVINAERNRMIGPFESASFEESPEPNR